MSQLLVVSFERAEDLLQAVQAARSSGWPIRDVCSPYAIHELAPILGLKRSWLPRACFLFGLCGVAFALSFQYWASAWDWPLNVGGRPFNSLPAFVPVTFESMVLLAGLGVVLTWLIVCRLYPGKKPTLRVPQASDNIFALVVEERPAEAEAMRQLFQDCHAVHIEEREETERR